MTLVHRRLLVVDDEPEIGVLISRIGRKCGYVVRSTTHPDEFTSLYADWRPTLVALDLAIPDIDGIELLRFIARQRTRSRIIVMSGMGATMLGVAHRFAETFGLDIAAVLEKPFRAQYLADLLRTAEPPNPPRRAIPCQVDRHGS